MDIVAAISLKKITNLFNSYLRDVTWSLMDQIVYSFSSFLIGIYLANQLTISEFGQFNIAWITQILIVVVHAAIIVDPFVVLSKTKYSNFLLNYHDRLLTIQVIGLVIISLIIGVVLKTIYKWDLLLTLCFVLYSLVSALLQFYRRSLYSLGKISQATIGGILNIVFTFISLLLFYGRLNVVVGFICISIGGFVGLTHNFLVAKNSMRNNFANFNTSSIFVDQWNFGKWLLLSSIFSWLPINLYPYILPTRIGGIEEVGVWRALINLIVPLQLVLANFSVFFTVKFSEHVSSGKKIFNFILMIGIAYAFLVFVYGIFLCVGGQYVLHLLYLGKYDQYVGYLPYFGLIPLLSGWHSLLGSALKAYDQTSVITFSSALGFLSAFLFIPLILWGGVITTPILNALAYALMLLPMLFKLYQLNKS